MLDVNHIISDGEIAKVGDKGGYLGFGAAGLAHRNLSFVGEVLRAEEDDLTCGGLIEVEDLHACGDGSLDDDGRAKVAGEVTGLGVDGGRALLLGTRTETVGNLVLLQETGETLDLALIGGGEQDARLLLHERLDRLDERGDRAVKTLRGARGELNLGELVAFGIKHVDGAELIEIAASGATNAVGKVPRGEVDVFGANEGADAGAIVALFDLIPPAFALVLDHCGLFDKNTRGRTKEIKQRLACSGDGSEELPSGEDGGFTGARGYVRLQLDWLFATFECGSGCSCAGEAGVDGGEKLFSDGRLGERKQEDFIERGAGALGVGIEAADGLDLVAEEVDADGAVLLGGEDVNNAAANRHLAGHLYDVDAGIADGEEVFHKKIGDVLFTDAQVERERGVVVAAEEAHAGRLDGGDDESRRVAGADLP